MGSSLTIFLNLWVFTALHSPQGNDGMAIAETDIDSFGLVTLSYGNQGLNPDLVVESGCTSSNGTVDCTGKTVQVCM